MREYFKSCTSFILFNTFRLHFKMLLIDEYSFKIPTVVILVEICIKMGYFYLKIAKVAHRWVLRLRSTIQARA